MEKKITTMMLLLASCILSLVLNVAGVLTRVAVAQDEIPVGATITSAFLYVHTTLRFNSGQTVNVHRIDEE
ncbi:MAG: hypothetical protein WGN25_01440 [Candidatus Electrothrix sp. GW3-4]|uniref:hypothetical protein n=1 Tax=Candidatus Electrothrix sp. GW3-4 TaxID=3126740 RepID=UPI0030CFFA70